MGTGTSKRAARSVTLLALASLALVLSACGGSSGGGSTGGGTTGGGSSGGGTTGSVSQRAASSGDGASKGATPTGAFSWLRPEHPPSNWTVVRIPTGAELAYPPNWRPQHGDRGTATAALLGADGDFLGYLNLTPRQSNETLSDWSSFRLDHNREEGDRAVRQLAAATGLHFLSGHGSCVKDAYSTITNAHFVEIACLVAGARAESVIIGAAPPGAWGRISPTIERAIAGLQT